MITEKDFGLTPEEKVLLVQGAQKFLPPLDDDDDNELLIPPRVDPAGNPGNS